MFRTMMLVAAVCLVSTAASAQSQAPGDASAGQRSYLKCQTCHVVADDEGNILAGRPTPIGPNLYGMIGRPAASVDGFRYSPSLTAAGEAGLVWNEETFVAYLLDPNGFVREYLDDSSARSTMPFRLQDSQEARNLAAYLNSLEQ
jgi:cytochrome c